MELLFKKNIIGYIDNIFKEDNWIHGVFIQNDNFKNYIEFFKAIVWEAGFDETKFDNELLEDENWSVKDNESIIGIYIPAIYADGDISFRYR